MSTSAQRAAPNLPEPPRSIPRWFFVRRMQGLLFASVLVVLLPLVAGSAPAVLLVSEDHLTPIADWAIDRDGVTAVALITAVVARPHIRINNRNPWRVSFRYSPGGPAGQPVEASGYTFDADVGRRAVGDEIMIEYDPQNPRCARPAGGRAAAMPGWVFFMLSGLVAAGAVAVLTLPTLLVVLARRERKLLIYGVGAQAELTDIREVSYINFGRRHPFDVRYRFTDHCRRPVSGRDRTYEYAWAAALKPGDRILVVYNPYVPTINALWLAAANPPQRAGETGAPDVPAWERR